jgi:hypothetical protein
MFNQFSIITINVKSLYDFTIYQLLCYFFIESFITYLLCNIHPKFDGSRVNAA